MAADLELCYLSAAEALRLFARRELSPVELLNALIARSDETEPIVKAFAETRFDDARAQAVDAERRYAGRGPTPRPLEGLAVAVKEEMPIQGWRWTMGSLILKDEIAPHTSCLAQRLLDAGAIVHARTTTPEFSAGPYTMSRLWGITRNPWNPDFAVGGSSGGSAAALAAGSTTLATGSDVAGSIRIPSSFCGVVGFKPPYGRVPADPPYNLEPYLTNGAMGRSVADVALMQNVLAGPHPADPNVISPKLTLPDRFAEVRGMRVALSVDFGGWPVDDDVRTRTLEAADLLRDRGAIVESVDLDIPTTLVSRVSSLHFAATISDLQDLLDAHPDLVSRYLAMAATRIADQGRPGESAVEEWELANELHTLFAAVHGDFDVILCPTVATVGFPADEDYVDNRLVVGGVEVADPIEAVFTVPFNVLNRYPVLAVPSGRSTNGVPTGVQLVGRPYADESVFTMGAALESGVNLGVPPTIGAFSDAH